MAKQKPGDEKHRPGDDPDLHFPTDEADEDILEVVDDEADIVDITEADEVSGSGVRLGSSSDADLLAQLAAEEAEEEVVDLTAADQPDVLPFAPEPTAEAAGPDAGLPVGDDSSTVDLAGLEAQAPTNPPSGVGMDFAGVSDVPLTTETSGVWQNPPETVAAGPVDSGLKLGPPEPTDSSISGTGSMSDIALNFDAIGDEPLTREGGSSTWQTEIPPTVSPGDQGSVIDLGVPEPAGPAGGVSDLRLVPDAMDSGTIHEASGEVPPSLGAGDPTEAELDLGALDRSPDIAEQIESNKDLPRTGPEDVVDLNHPVAETETAGEDEDLDLAAAATAAANEDEEVDLGAPGGEEEVDPDMQALADEFANAGAEQTEESPVEETETAEESAPAKKPAKAARQGGGIGGVLVGTVVGLVIGAGGLYGSMAAGVVDPALLGLAPARPTPQVRQQPVADAPTAEKAEVALGTGDLDRAIEVFTAVGGEDPKVLAAHGQALWLKSLQNLAKKNDFDPAKVGEELKKDESFTKAKEMLTKASADNADAVFWLAEIEEWTEGAGKAKARLQEGLQKFAADPTQKQRFEAALNRLSLQAAAPKAGEARLLRPGAIWVALALVAMQAEPEIPGDPKPVPEQEEAGDEFWKAVGLAQKRQFPQAIEALNKAQKIHARQRLLRPKQQQNPRSDPREHIFLTACDEIRSRWQFEAGYVAELDKLKAYETLLAELKAQKEPAKVLAALIAAVQGVAAEITTAKLEKLDDPKKLTLADLAGAIKVAGTGSSADKEKVDAIVAALKDAKVDKFKDAAEGMAFTKEELTKGVQALTAQVAAERAKVDAVVAALKAAKVDKFKDAAEDATFTKDDLLAGVKALGDAQAKVESAVAALKDAKVEKLTTPAEGILALAGERDKAQTELAAANATLDAVVKPLVENKHLPAGAKRADAPKGVANVLATADHPAVKGLAEAVRELAAVGGKASDEMLKGIDLRAQLVTTNAENMRLRAQMADRWSPEQMLPVWRAALQSGDKAMIEMALKDIARVTDPAAKGKAWTLTALVARNQGRFDEARAALKAVKLPEDSPWRVTADWLTAELTDLRVAYLPAIRRARDEGDYARALELTDEAMAAFPKDGFVKENTTLTVVRGLLRLEKALASGRVSPEVAKAVEADAAAALAGGETIEGNYLAGRVAEATGDLAKAEASFKAALQAYLAANPRSDETLAAFRKDHPSCDPIGNRYRVALSRVMVAQRGGVPAPFTPPQPKEEKKPGVGVGRPAAALPTKPKIILVADARKDAGVGQSDGPAAVAVAPVRPLPTVAWVGGCPSVLSLPIILVDPGVMVGDEGAGGPADPRLDEAVRLAEEAVRLARTSRDPRASEAFLVLGEARARRGNWTEGLFDFVEGLKVLCPQYGPRLAVLVSEHPAFKRPDAIRPPDPLRAEGFYARGLRLYFEHRYGAAEQEFYQAVRFNDQDARYWYFLGLSRLGLGKRDLAMEDFRTGARLEVLEKPGRAAVSYTLERVQGPDRRLLNAFRDRAEREAVGVAP